MTNAWSVTERYGPDQSGCEPKTKKLGKAVSLYKKLI
jgi:hypothetical protein